MVVREQTHFGLGRAKCRRHVGDRNYCWWFVQQSRTEQSRYSYYIIQSNPQKMAVFSPIQLVASIPPVTRSFTAATVLFSLFYIYLQWQSEARYPVPYLTLVPGSSLFYPWTLFTSVFVETSIYEVRRYAAFGKNPY